MLAGANDPWSNPFAIGIAGPVDAAGVMPAVLGGPCHPKFSAVAAIDANAYGLMPNVPGRS